MKKIFQSAIVIAVATASFSFYVQQEKDNVLTDKEKKAGWVLLFDGKTMNGWKTYQGKEQEGWSVVNGELFCKEEGPKK